MHRTVAISLTVLALLAFATPLFADTIVEIGDDGSHASGAANNDLYHDRRSESIYFKEDIGRGGTITSIGLFATEAPYLTLNNWTIRLRTTDWSKYPDSGGTFTPAGEWTVCYTGDVQTDAWSVNEWSDADGQWSTSDWTTFTLDTPYAYDGSENLMVDFSFNNSQWAGLGAVRTTVHGSDSYRIYYGLDSDPNHPDPLQWDFEGSESYYTPDIQIGFSDGGGEPVPEPGTLALFGIGLPALIGWKRRREG
jgi:hypothetical protein